MTIGKLVWAFIRRRPVTWAFHVLLLAVAVAVTVSVLLVREAADAGLTRDLAGIDLVVGAEGSPLQLVMSTVFQADAPTGNIPLATAEQLARDPLVSRAVPVSLGDSVGLYRIVGTTLRYRELHDAELAQGRWWSEPMQAVIGAVVAQRLGLNVGDTFVGAHGLDGTAETHAERPYRIVGVLHPTGAVVDRLVLTDLSSVWALHGPHETGAAEAAQAHPDHDAAAHEPAAPREITAVLVEYRSALGAVVLPPRIAGLAGLQAASPAREAQRLNALIGDGAALVERLGQALLVLAAAGFAMALSTAVLARRRELALLKALGAHPARLSAVVILEGGLLGLIGGLVGLGLGRLVAWAVARSDVAPLALSLPAPGLQDGLVVLAALALGLVAAAPAAFVAIRTDAVKALQGER